MRASFSLDLPSPRPSLLLSQTLRTKGPEHLVLTRRNSADWGSLLPTGVAETRGKCRLLRGIGLLKMWTSALPPPGAGRTWEQAKEARLC